MNEIRTINDVYYVEVNLSSGAKVCYDRERTIEKLVIIWPN